MTALATRSLATRLSDIVETSVATPGVVAFPKSTVELQATLGVLREANQSFLVTATAHNWGYTAGTERVGDSNSVTISLQNMCRIRTYDADLGTVTIEPGVTQGALAQFLAEKGDRFFVDTTSAGESVSIVGNICDRGFGNSALGNRATHVLSVELLLADGSLVQSDSTSLFTNQTHTHAENVATPFAPGPGLVGLAIQSNLAIVTAMQITLNRRAEYECALGFELTDTKRLPEFIEAIRDLKQLGHLPGCLHVANDLRIISNLTRLPRTTPPDLRPLTSLERSQLRSEHGTASWTGFTLLGGTRDSVKAELAAIRQRVGALARTRTLTPNKIYSLRRTLERICTRWPRILNIKPIARLRNKLERGKILLDTLRGKPSNELLYNTGWRCLDLENRAPTPQELDAGSNVGILWYAPAVALKRDAVRRVMEVAEPIFERHGFDMLTMFTFVTDRHGVVVFNILFDARHEKARARACYQELLARGRVEGFFPYRLPAFAWEEMAGQAKPTALSSLHARLKKALDPSGLIAPGRYGIG